MKRPQFNRPSGSRSQSRNALMGGSYSLVVTAVVLAILIKAVVAGLEEDVTIYWVVQSDKEDDVIENLLSKYDSLSDHISVVKKNPDVYPTFTQTYTDETVPNNSLIVECGDRSRYISYNDIYIQDASMYSYSYSTSFDGEGAITSAIDYVTRDELPQLYLLEGHGESELPADFADQVEKENIETVTFSLLTVDAVPEEADCVMIYAPTSDISTEEKDMLADYVAQGGKLMVVAGPTEDGLPENLYSLLADYGVTASEGIVVEENREYYAFQMPYVLLPDLVSGDITDPLIEENYYVFMPISAGLTVSGNSSAGTVTSLLTTSDSAFSKLAGYDLDTYEREEGDIDGPFTLAVSVEDNSGGQIIWFASSYFLDDMYNAYSSGANSNLGMNALASLVGETDAMAIRSKSLNYNYLSISESTSSMLKTVMIGVCPLVYLGIGIAVVVKQRRNQNEPC